jgi:MFS family permease
MTSPSTHRFLPLIGTLAGLRLADQLAVASVPLMGAALFGAGPREIGLMVALQGSAWLIMSLPAGLWVDRSAPGAGLRIGAGLQIVAMLVMLAGVVMGSAAVLTAGAFASACAAVLAMLSEGPVYQRVATPAELPWLNGRVQIAQSAAMLAMPVLVGLAISHGVSGWLLAVGVGVAVASSAFARLLPPLPAAERPERHPLAEMKEGIAFVRREPLLMGILWCSLFWNFAFFALAAQFSPFALQVLKLDAGQIGWSQGMMGIGSLVAAFTAAHVMRRVAPNVILFFGPASSFLGAVLLPMAAASGIRILPAITYFLLGFGPILWFVCQNTLRQIITPQGLLGRVGSVIQFVMYGVRSIGALASGAVAGEFGYGTGLSMVAAAFALSALVVPFSALMRLSAMPETVTSPIAKHP